MIKVLHNANKKSIYNNSMLSLIAHAIMVGAYPELAHEHSWNEKTYSFQDSIGGRGAISFQSDYFICVIQNKIKHSGYSIDNVEFLISGAEKKYLDLASSEALQYVLDDINGVNLPFISAVFWGDNANIYSNQTEKEIVLNATEMLAPLISDYSHSIYLWSKYYNMSVEQIEMLELIYNLRLSNVGQIQLSNNMLHILLKWFGEIDQCIESFNEIMISFDRI